MRDIEAVELSKEQLTDRLGNELVRLKAEMYGFFVMVGVGAYFGYHRFVTFIDSFKEKLNSWNTNISTVIRQIAEGKL
jgi:hypothetical protein